MPSLQLKPHRIALLATYPLKHQRRTFSLLITAINQALTTITASSGGEYIPQLKVLASLQGQLRLRLTRGTFQPQHYLLGSFRLLVEYWLRLSTVT